MNARALLTSLVAIALVAPLAGAIGERTPVHATGTNVHFFSDMNDCETTTDTVTFDLDTDGDVTVVDSGPACGMSQLFWGAEDCTGTAATDISCAIWVVSEDGSCWAESFTVFLGIDGRYEQRLWIPSNACDGTWAGQTTVTSTTPFVRT